MLGPLGKFTSKKHLTSNKSRDFFVQKNIFHQIESQQLWWRIPPKRIQTTQRFLMSSWLRSSKPFPQMTKLCDKTLWFIQSSYFCMWINCFIGPSSSHPHHDLPFSAQIMWTCASFSFEVSFASTCKCLFIGHREGFFYSGQSLKIVFVIFPAICNIELSKKGNIFHSTPPAWHFWKMIFLFPPCGFSGDGSLKNHSFKSTPPNEPSCCVGLGLDWSFNFNLLAWWEVKILPMAVPQQKNWSVLALGIHSVLNQKYQKQLESNVCFLIISKDWQIISRFVKFETPFDIFETSSTSQTNSWFNQCNPLKLGTVPSKNRTWEILRTCHPPRSYEKPFLR